MPTYQLTVYILPRYVQPLCHFRHRFHPLSRNCLRALNMAVPSTFQKLSVTKQTYKFREAVQVVNVPLPPPAPHDVVIRNKYVGINATDVNISAGRYFVDRPPPFDVGLEGIGHIAAVGSEVTHLKVGQAVLHFGLGAFAEYKTLSAKDVIPVPEAKADYVALLISGLTASLSLDKVGEIKAGEKVLITAAAGGTGHLAVQWAKNAGCHVIGTCSTKEKVEMLMKLGCDRVINYKEEDLDQVLTKEYAEGIDVVWETIGGKTFETLLKHLAIGGRLIVVGAISGYKTEGGTGAVTVDLSHWAMQLLQRSTSIRGFMLSHFHAHFPQYLKDQIDRMKEGRLKTFLDLGASTKEGPFTGLSGIIRGVEHLHSGSNSGKVVVAMP